MNARELTNARGLASVCGLTNACGLTKNVRGLTKAGGLAVVVWRTRRWLPGDQRWLTKPPVPTQHGADNVIVLD